MTFEEYLVDKSIISPELLNKIMEYANQNKCTNYLAARKCVENDKLLVQATCEFFGYTYIKRGYGVAIDIEKTSRAGDVFDLTDRNSFIASDSQNTYYLIYDPTDDRLLQRLTAQSEEGAVFAMCSSKTYEAIYDLSVRPALLSIRADKFKENTTQKSNVQASTTDAQDLLNEMLTAAISQRASDIHIMPLGEQDGLVRIRVDGVLRDYACISSAVLPMFRQLIINKVKVGGDTVNRPVEGQFDFPYKGSWVDTRVNIVNAKLGPDFNLRFIRSELKSLEDIGLSAANKEQYRRLLRLTKGMVIVTGPTGSGKSTLLYAGCREIASKEISLFAIEDPVEIVLPQITQINIQPERNYTYSDALKSALRHDPNVILIGEIRDREVAEEAIRASNTGHLVFTTLHTNDALGGLTRLINIGIDPYSLGDCLAAIVAQRLVRRVCPHCKARYKLPSDHVWRKRYDLGNEDMLLTKGDGCEACSGTGYLGRIAINEILTITPELSHAIQQRQTKTALHTIIKKQGFVSFLDDGKEKALQGITTFNELDPFKLDIL